MLSKTVFFVALIGSGLATPAKAGTLDQPSEDPYSDAPPESNSYDPPQPTNHGNHHSCEGSPQPTKHGHHHSPQPTKHAHHHSHGDCKKPKCGRPGIKYKKYTNPFVSDNSPDYTSFDISYFPTQTPIEQGTVDRIIVTSSPPIAIEYTTYIYACKSGVYEFYSPGTDDITLAWFGKDHVRNPTRENVDIQQTYFGTAESKNEPKTVKKHIKAGTYYPILVWYGNTGGPALLELRITEPGGTPVKAAGSFNKGPQLRTRACGADEGRY
ncbi:GLEYA motif domain-containing protein [Hirsutella rhossiliensis]|uniref:GLEYA domain-containing protein n=1 Tax=Hirsutella rhossiliensis TaxID=111463 RepID=A0A9P8MUY4_9HYPO|nr:GLEYA domain-containing protein [Hirsutella rhossiliensis]KAH0961877.1 GLEYA domain-containing protein [Hirsutella rhossiliensis]